MHNKLYDRCKTAQHMDATSRAPDGSAKFQSYSRLILSFVFVLVCISCLVFCVFLGGVCFVFVSILFLFYSFSHLMCPPVHKYKEGGGEGGVRCTHHTPKKKRSVGHKCK